STRSSPARPSAAATNCSSKPMRGACRIQWRWCSFGISPIPAGTKERRMSWDAVVGVDGCPGGWIAVWYGDGGEPMVRVFPGFAALIGEFSGDATIAVDMPIGLPDFSRRGGRGPEALVRPLLGRR